MCLCIDRKQQRKKEFVSIQYDGRDLLILVPLLFGLLGMVGAQSVGYLIIPSIILYALFIYVHFLIKKNFRIKITDDAIIWETIWKKKTIPMSEVSFLGISDDYMQRYMNCNTVYAKDKQIHLLAGNFRMSFNPKCFYEENSFFKIIGDEKEQLSWKEKDSALISFLEERCTLSIDENKKKLLLRKISILDFVEKIFLLLIYTVPVFPVIYFELLLK